MEIIVSPWAIPVGLQLAADAEPSPGENPWDQHNAIASRFDTRVRFWGKVVDQKGAPLQGVEIVATVTTLRMIKTENGYREYEVLKATSDADGTFIFDGSEGMYLDIEALTKEGYVLPSAYQFGMSCKVGAKFQYRYSSMGGGESVFIPTPASPEVFHLWKINKPEPLTIGGDGSGLSGPELKVGAPPEPSTTISMMITSVGTHKDPQWEVTVSALEPDGGFVMAEASDIFMFEAPAAGYSHSIRFKYGPVGADQGAGDPGASLRFFARTHNGRWHTACEYAFFAPDQNGTVLTQVRSWRNPNGSRNLEHDGAHPLPPPHLSQ
ncbi:MAG: carboxypeptidase-like regulatory domain-containing protein [Verrucomicrobiota bacterium]